jgi:hypothetical protein
LIYKEFYKKGPLWAFFICISWHVALYFTLPTNEVTGMKKTINDVVSAFPQTSRDKYDFSNAVYTSALKPLEGVVCPEHGAFKQYAAQFRKGRGCPSCGHDERGLKKRVGPEHYFAEVSRIHGDRYDYSGTTFTIMNRKIEVRCPDHGLFSIGANHHYYRKQGCGQCET